MPTLWLVHACPTDEDLGTGKADWYLFDHVGRLLDKKTVSGIGANADCSPSLDAELSGSNSFIVQTGYSAHPRIEFQVVDKKLIQTEKNSTKPVLGENPSWTGSELVNYDTQGANTEEWARKMQENFTSSRYFIIYESRLRIVNKTRTYLDLQDYYVNRNTIVIAAIYKDIVTSVSTGFVFDQSFGIHILRKQFFYNMSVEANFNLSNYNDFESIEIDDYSLEDPYAIPVTLPSLPLALDASESLLVFPQQVNSTYTGLGFVHINDKVITYSLDENYPGELKGFINPSKTGMYFVDDASGKSIVYYFAFPTKLTIRVFPVHDHNGKNVDVDQVLVLENNLVFGDVYWEKKIPIVQYIIVGTLVLAVFVIIIRRFVINLKNQKLD